MGDFDLDQRGEEEWFTCAGTEGGHVPAWPDWMILWIIQNAERTFRKKWAGEA